MLIVLPDYISDQIDRALEAELEKHPDAAPDREIFRQHLIAHFAETGLVPEFTLARKSLPDTHGNSSLKAST